MTQEQEEKVKTLRKKERQQIALAKDSNIENAIPHMLEVCDDHRKMNEIRRAYLDTNFMVVYNMMKVKHSLAKMQEVKANYFMQRSLKSVKIEHGGDWLIEHIRLGGTI